MRPLVSIVTPTIPGREDQLFGRCMPSVLAQSWDGRIEHIIVSDRNPELDRDLRMGSDLYSLRIIQLNETWRTPAAVADTGAVPWHVGSLLALGDYIGFLGDDDELLPDHVSRHVSALNDHEADFSISQVEFRANGTSQFVIGDASFAHGHLDANGIMCRPRALAVQNWSVGSPGDFDQACDYRLVRAWIKAGLRGVFIDEGPTAIHHDGWVIGKTGKP